MHSHGTLEVTLQLVDVHGVVITVKAMFELLLVRRPIPSVTCLVDEGVPVVMGNEQGNTLGKDGRVIYLHKSNGVHHVRATALSELCPLGDQDPRNYDAPPVEAVGEAHVPWTRRLSYKPTEDETMALSVSHLPFRAWCPHCVKGLARDWPHRSDYGPLPDIPMVAMDFRFVNTGADDDVLTILAMKEKPFQSVGATVLPDKTASEFAVATIIGYLDFWGHQEDMIKCDQEQSMKRIAELLLEWRRPRRTIVEYSPKGSHQSNRVVEKVHHHLEGLLRTMRSDLMEKTGVNVNVESHLAPWLARHCAWSLMRFANGADGHTAFKRQRGKDYVGETVCFGEAICHPIPLRISTKMEPRWQADGVFLGKLDLSDEVIVGTPKGIETTRSFRGMTKDDRQWNPETLRMFVGVPWNPRGITTDAPVGIRNSYITRALVQTHGGTNGCAACQGDSQVHVPGCRKRSEDIFDREKLPGQPREVVQQGDQRVQMEQEPQRHAPILEPSAQPSSSSHAEPMDASQHDASSCKNP